MIKVKIMIENNSSDALFMLAYFITLHVNIYNSVLETVVKDKMRSL